MPQRLVLPINDLLVTAGYKNPVYQKTWKWVHYGLDCISSKGVRTVYACGDGEVIACGQDGSAPTGSTARLGNVIVVVYRDVLCNDGKTRDLTCRNYHLDSIFVKPGSRVTKNTALGRYGNTGAHSSGPHLHVEFDTDVQYPCLAPGISAGGQVINQTSEMQKYGTIDSTINAAAVWFVDVNQTIGGSQYTGPLAYTPVDASAPPLPNAVGPAKPTPPAERPAIPTSPTAPPKVYAVYELAGQFETETLANDFAARRGKKTIVCAE